MQPKLRFKEFSNDWTLSKLSECSDIYDGTHTTPDYKESGVPFYSVEHVTSGNFSNTKFISLEVFEKENKRVRLEKGDILMTRIGDIGTPKYLDWDVQASFYVSLALIKPKNKNGLFLSQYILSQFFQKELHERTIHVAFPKKINLGEIGECLVKMPHQNEQTKIASFLSAVDQKITQITKQKELLTQYKKGVMQKIFNQEIRFGDGKYSKWEVNTLGELGKFISGTGFADAEQGGSEGVPFYKVSDMNLPGNELKMNTANNYVSNDQITRLKLKPIKDSAIIFAKVGAAIFHERKRVASNFLIDNNMMAFIPRYETEFMKHCFDFIRLSKFAQVGALPSYNASDLSLINVTLPTSIEERQKIASVLSALDEKIEKTGKRLDLTKQYKQGLLQQMFI